MVYQSGTGSGEPSSFWEAKSYEVRAPAIGFLMLYVSDTRLLSGVSRINMFMHMTNKQLLKVLLYWLRYQCFLFEFSSTAICDPLDPTLAIGILVHNCHKLCWSETISLENHDLWPRLATVGRPLCSTTC